MVTCSDATNTAGSRPQRARAPRLSPRHGAPRFSALLPVLQVASITLACRSGESDVHYADNVESTAPPPSLVANVELSNPSSAARQNSLLFWSYRDLGLSPAEAATRRLWLEQESPSGAPLEAGEREALPVQAIDRDGDGTKDGIVTLIDLPAGAVQRLNLMGEVARPEGPRVPQALHESPAEAKVPALTQAVLSVKRGGEWKPRAGHPTLQEYVGGTFEDVRQFTPPPEHTDHSQLIRFEGPGIESDRAGYRIYLDERNGFDVFGKKTPLPVLQSVGLDGYESYHHPAPWGMDILKVGPTLGTGGFGFWTGTGVERVQHLQGWNAQVLEPVGIYSAFRITYSNWKIGALETTVRADFSMQGGSRLVHAELSLSAPLPNLAIGVRRHPEAAAVMGPLDVPESAYTYVASWGPQAEDGSLLGMAVLFRRGALQSRQTTDADHLAVVEPSGQEFDYYFEAAWAGEPGGIANQEAFVAHLEEERERLDLPLRQRLETTRSAQAKHFPTSAQSALDWARRLADSELARKTLLYRQGGWDTNRRRAPRFEYDTSGLLPMAYDELAQEAPSPAYQNVAEAVTGSFVDPSGRIETFDEAAFSLDSVMPGEVLLRLYARTHDDRYRVATGELRRALARHPRTREGAFWHKARYPSQIWLDGVYMGMPFLARYSATFENGASLDEVVREFILTREHLRDPATGLYAHAWDEARRQSWAHPRTGHSPHYWGRGLGWLSMALVDVLDHIPTADTQHRAPLLGMIAELAPALLAVQDAETGTWWQVLDLPRAPGNYRESSASAMFTYFLAKATRKGYLPGAYRSAAIRAFDGLVRQFIRVYPDEQVSLTNQCLVAGLGYGRDGSYRYYMSEPIWQDDPKATGSFILAGVELHRLLEQSERALARDARR